MKHNNKRHRFLFNPLYRVFSSFPRKRSPAEFYRVQLGFPRFPEVFTGLTAVFYWVLPVSFFVHYFCSPPPTGRTFTEAATGRESLRRRNKTRTSVIERSTTRFVGPVLFRPMRAKKIDEAVHRRAHRRHLCTFFQLPLLLFQADYEIFVHVSVSFSLHWVAALKSLFQVMFNIRLPFL